MPRLFLVLLVTALFVTAGDARATQQPVSPQVDIYLTSWCPFCKQAVDFFRDRSIPVRIYNIEKDPLAAQRKQRLDPRRGVPLVVIGEQVIYGFSPRAYSVALEE